MMMQDVTGTMRLRNQYRLERKVGKWKIEEKVVLKYLVLRVYVSKYIKEIF